MRRAKLMLLSVVLVAAWSAPATAASVVHRPAQVRATAQRTTVTSTNWSGYADRGATFSDVRATWTQPAVSCARAQTAYSSFWVGLDGYGSNSVEQIGTDSDCSFGTPTYYAWYEMYPAGSVTLSSAYRVAAGDSITADVTASGTSFTLSLSNNTRGWHFSTVEHSSTATRSSAEWVAEAPSSCYVTCRTLPLADFGTVTFAASSVNGAAISSYSDTEIVMASGATVKAKPSALSGVGHIFADTWYHS